MRTSFLVRTDVESDCSRAGDHVLMAGVWTLPDDLTRGKFPRKLHRCLERSVPCFLLSTVLGWWTVSASSAGRHVVHTGGLR